MNQKENNEVNKSIKKLENLGMKLDDALKAKIITNEDILNVIKLRSDLDALKLTGGEGLKNQILQDVYFNPYILFFAKELSEQVEKTLPKFIEFQYMKKINEFEKENLMEFKQRDMALYEAKKEWEHFIYFESSPIGKKIFDEINNKKKKPKKK